MPLPVLHRFLEFTLPIVSYVGIHSSLAFLLSNHCKSGVSLYPLAFFWQEKVINIMSLHCSFFLLVNYYSLYCVHSKKNLKKFVLFYEKSLSIFTEHYKRKVLPHIYWHASKNGMIFILIFREVNLSITRSLFSTSEGII